MRRQAGFTLLEATVALIIAALAIAALFQGAGIGVKAAASSARYEQALVRAKSHLETTAYSGRLTAGTFQGDDGGGYHWLVRVAPIQTATIRPSGLAGSRAASQPLVLYSVSAAITWNDGGRRRQVVLATEQIGSP
jgi:general secretion pathway protein I